MRETPPASTAIGDGELASHIEWKDGEITFSGARFALEHASGQGQAVVTLKAPRPHIRAAFALDHLDLNPFLAGARPKASPAAEAPPTPGREPMRLVNHGPFHTALMQGSSDRARAELPADWFGGPKAAMIDGRGHIWSPFATEPQALWHYTLIRHRHRAECFTAFRANHWLGFAVFAGTVVDLALR